MLIGAAVVVVVVGALLVLALVGVLPWFKTSGSTGTTFAATRSAAQSTANSYSGGGWQLVAAGGLASRNSSGASTSFLTGSLGGAGCTFVPAPGATMHLELATVGDVSVGQAGSWVFLFKNLSGTGLLAVEATSGSTGVLGSVGGSGCFGGALSVVSPIGTSVIDSSAAATTANSNGGTAFLTAHAYAWASYTLAPGFSLFGTSTNPQWTVTYSACTLNSSVPSTAASFTATVDAQTGALLHASGSTVTCVSLGGGTGVGSALTLGAPQVSQAGSDYWYNFSVEAAAGGLTAQDVAFEVQSSATSAPIVLTGASLDLLGLTGASAASYAATGPLWTSTSTLALSSAMTISLETTTSLSGLGYEFVAIGIGSFSGTTGVAIP